MSPSVPQQQSKRHGRRRRITKRTSMIAALPDDDDITPETVAGRPPPTTRRTATATTITITTTSGSRVGDNTSTTANTGITTTSTTMNLTNHRYQHVLRPRKKQNRSSNSPILPSFDTVRTNIIAPPPPAQPKTTLSSTVLKEKTKKAQKNDIMVVTDDSVVPLSTGATTLPTGDQPPSSRSHPYLRSYTGTTRPDHHADVPSRTCSIPTRRGATSTPKHLQVLPVVTPHPTTTITILSTPTDGRHWNDISQRQSGIDTNNIIAVKHYYDPAIGVDRTPPPPGVMDLFPDTQSSKRRRASTTHHPSYVPTRAGAENVIRQCSNDYITTYGLEYLFLLQSQPPLSAAPLWNHQNQHRPPIASAQIKQQQRGSNGLTPTTCAESDDDDDDGNENKQFISIVDTQNQILWSQQDCEEEAEEEDEYDDEKCAPTSTKRGNDNDTNDKRDDVESTKKEEDHDAFPTTELGTPDRPFPPPLSPLTMDDVPMRNETHGMTTPSTTSVNDVTIVATHSLPGSGRFPPTSIPQQRPHNATTAAPNIRHQPMLTTKMRQTLVLWLSEVCHEFHLSDATYHLAVTLVDQTLMCQTFPIRREQFQAVGCVCLWIASKLEDVKTPSRHELCYISDYSVSNGQLLRLERHICSLLQFRLQHVTPYHLLPLFVRASTADASTTASSSTIEGWDPIDVPFVSMVKYLLELSRASYLLSQERPDLLAASCVYLARATLGIVGNDEKKQNQPKDQYWTKTLTHYTTYDTTDMVDTIITIYGLQIAAESAASKGVDGCPAYKRYRTTDHHCVSLKVPPRLEDLGLPNLDMDYDDFLDP